MTSMETDDDSLILAAIAALGNLKDPSLLSPLFSYRMVRPQLFGSATSEPNLPANVHRHSLIIANAGSPLLVLSLTAAGLFQDMVFITGSTGTDVFTFKDCGCAIHLPFWFLGNNVNDGNLIEVTYMRPQQSCN